MRVHDDGDAHALADGLGANAVTVGNDIFFASGRYAPETAAGERLLAHELAHVAQQGGEPRALQCDLAQSMLVTLGVFDMNMVTQPAGPGPIPVCPGRSPSTPDPHGPYSAEIGLVQAINITDRPARPIPASGSPLDWRNVTDVEHRRPGHRSGPHGDDDAGHGGRSACWLVHRQPALGHAARQQHRAELHRAFRQCHNQFGWLRSPPTSARRRCRFPTASFDTDFDFETVAKGTDNQTVYGSLFWGFTIRSGAVVGSSEYAFQADGGTSATFEEALERFRGYYVHEPVILYFDTGDPIPRAGEEAKLADIPDYMDRYPDVMIEIDGWADIRGSEASNVTLAQQRADAAASLLALHGVDPSRIGASGALGFGETQQFSQHGTAPGATQPITAGRLQANRRVEIRFVHTVSNHPIVMP